MWIGEGPLDFGKKRGANRTDLVERGAAITGKEKGGRLCARALDHHLGKKSSKQGDRSGEGHFLARWRGS